jgi:hypothetical protein
MRSVLESMLPLYCPSCGHANPAEANYCNNCGVPVYFEECGDCGAINRRGSAHCHKCGQSLSTPVAPPGSAPAVLRVRRPIEPKIEPSPSDDESAAAAWPQPAKAQASLRSRAGLCAALAAVALIALAIPSYLSFENPDRFRELFSSTTAVSEPSLQPATTAQPPNPGPPAQAGNDPKPEEKEITSVPPSEVAREFHASPADTTAQAAPPATGGTHSNTSKSSASHAKQSTSSKKSNTRKTPSKPANRPHTDAGVTDGSAPAQ